MPLMRAHTDDVDDGSVLTVERGGEDGDGGDAIDNGRMRMRMRMRMRVGLEEAMAA